MKEVAKDAFKEFLCVKSVRVPVGMKEYFLNILPEHLAKHVVERGKRL